jgi:hypothetical protein
MFVPRRKHAYGPPRPVNGDSLLFYMQTMFVPRRKHAYGPPRPVTGIAYSYSMQSYGRALVMASCNELEMFKIPRFARSVTRITGLAIDVFRHRIATAERDSC